jgi:hypothetical protein
MEIRVIPSRRAGRLREPISSIPVVAGARIPTGLAVALAVVGAFIYVTLRSGSTNASRAARGALVRSRGPAGVAAAYGYPVRCLSITISTHDPAYARADFDHASPCGRYDGPVTALFDRVDGAWRQVFVNVNYSCPVVALPVVVQEQLDVCLRMPRAATRRPRPVDIADVRFRVGRGAMRQRRRPGRRSSDARARS